VTLRALVEDALPLGATHPLSGTPQAGAAFSRLKSMDQADAMFDTISCASPFQKVH